MMEKNSINDFILYAIANESEPVQGNKGVTTVITIERQPEVFQALFTKMKHAGYTHKDLTGSHIKMLQKACIPKHISGKEQLDWNNQTFLTITKAEIAVFSTPYSKDAPVLNQEELDFYHERFKKLGEYFNEKYLRQKERGNSSKKYTSKKETPSNHTDFEMEDEEEYFEHPAAKPFNPDAFKEPIPEIIEDDFSFLPKRDNK